MSPKSRSRSWKIISIVVVIVAVLSAGVIFFLFRGKNEISGALLTTILGGILSPMLGPLIKRIVPEESPPPDDGAALNRLAKSIGTQWNETIKSRGLRPPINTRWKISEHSGAARNATDRSQFHGKQLPGVAWVTEESLHAGMITELRDIFLGLPSGRLILLGDAGTGKTAAAILTLTETLKKRNSSSDKRAFPVPILLLAQEWPGTPIKDWVTDRIAKDFRETLTPEQAERAVADGTITLIIDGFDEIGIESPESRKRRQELIDDLDSSGIRFMLISRKEALVDINIDSRLPGTVAIELCPTTIKEIIGYLNGTERRPVLEATAKLEQFLEQNPNSSIARVLQVPIYLSLFRDAGPYYNNPGGTVDALLENCDLDVEQLQSTILERVIPVAYAQAPSGYDEESAKIYLQFLAGKLKDEQSLRWWHIGSWVPMWPRILFTALVGMVLVLVTRTVGGLILQQVDHGFPITPAISALIGLVGGAAVGFASEERDRDAVAKKTVLGRAFARFNLATGLACALPVSSLAGVNSTYEYHDTAISVPLALFVGLAVFAVTGFFATGVSTPVGSRSTTKSFRFRRFNYVVALAVGLPMFFVITSFPVSYRLITALVFGLVFGFFDSLTQTQASSAIPSDPKQSWKADARKAVRGGAIFGVTIGLTIGIGGRFQASQAGDGLMVDVIVSMTVAAVIAIPAAVAVAAAMAEVWRTSLAFVQLRMRNEFPVNGMKFLDVAYKKNILRAAGPVYQFRHARLREFLAPHHADSGEVVTSGVDGGKPALDNPLR